MQTFEFIQFDNKTRVVSWSSSKSRDVGVYTIIVYATVNFANVQSNYQVVYFLLEVSLYVCPTTDAILTPNQEKSFTYAIGSILNITNIT